MGKTSVWKQLVLSAVLIGAAALGWFYRAPLVTAWSSLGMTSDTAVSEQRRSGSGTPVIVARVETAANDLTFSAIGTGFAERAVTLRAPSSGQIEALGIAPGARFTAGDTLMQLEATEEELAVDLAEARLDRARSERDRYLVLQDTGNAATARLEDAQTNYKVASIALDQARAELAKRRLLAPFDGVTGIAEVEVGDRVATDDAIGPFDDRSRILVEFDLPEALLSRVRPGLAVTARTPSVENRSFTGEVIVIDSRVDALTRTARVRAAITNEADLLRPGTSFALDLDLPGDTYPSVPELALQFSRGTLHLWRVADDGTAQQVEVQMIRRRGGQVLVAGEIAAGDRIVVEGIQRLRPGAEVDVLNTPPGSS